MKAMLNIQKLIQSAQKNSGEITLNFSIWKDVDGKLQYEKELSCNVSYERLLALAQRLGKYE